MFLLEALELMTDPSSTTQPLIDIDDEDSFTPDHGVGACDRRTRLGPRAKTVSVKRVSLRVFHHEKEMGKLIEPYDRPKTRGDCLHGKFAVRPCPFVGCAYHLYMDVDPESGNYTLRFPDRDPTELVDTCALDVADRGSHNLEEIGDRLNLTRERVRQIESTAIQSILNVNDKESLRSHLEGGLLSERIDDDNTYID